MKKFVYIFSAFIGLLIASGFMITRYVNFNQYKPFIEEQAISYLGRKIAIDGDIKLSILPTPSLNIYNVRLASIPGASEPNLLTFRKLKININLLPLISKKIEVSNVLISEPTVTLEQLKDGQKNWNIVTNNKSAPASINNAKSNVAVAPMDFSINTIEIVGGKIIYLDPTGQQSINDLTATLTSDSLSGPFKLNGFLKLADQDIRFQFKVKQLTDSIPVKLKLDLDSTDLNLDGVWVQSAGQFQGNVESKTNAKSFEATIKKLVPAFQLPEFISGPLGFAGRVTVSKDNLNIDNLIINVDQEIVNGRINARFIPRNINCALNGIPGNTELLLNLTEQNSHQIGQLQFKSQSIRKLMKWLAVPDVANIPDTLTGTTSFTTNFDINKQQIKFNTIELKIEDLVIKGRIDGDILASCYKYDLNANGLSPIAKYLKIPLHSDPGIIVTSGSLSLVSGAGTFDNKTNVAGVKIESSGKIEFDKQLQANIKLAAKTTDAKMLFKTFYDGAAPLENFDITSNISYDQKNINFDDINVMLGARGIPTYLAGFVRTQFGNRHLINAELKIDSLKLDNFIPVTQDNNIKNPSQPKFVPLKGQAANSKIESNSLQVSTDIAEKWSKLPINLSFFSDYDGKFKINIDKITRQDLEFKNFVITALLNKGIFNAPDMTADFFDGKMQGALNLDVSSDPSWTTQINIVDANVQRLVPTTGLIKIVKGTLNTKSDFNSHGKSLYDWIANLQGQLYFMVSHGAVSGFDLKTLSARLENISNPVALIELFSNSMTSGKTNFDECTATINFEKGVGSFQTLSLLADGGKGSGAGKINLPQYTLDLKGSFQLTDLPNLPPFKMHLSGLLDNPTKSFDTGDVEKFYVDSVCSKLKSLETGSLKGASDLISGLSGAKGPSNNNDNSDKKGNSTSNSNDKSSSINDIVAKPTEAIGNALKKLF